jgi:hypothetical protein
MVRNEYCNINNVINYNYMEILSERDQVMLEINSYFYQYLLLQHDNTNIPTTISCLLFF